MRSTGYYEFMNPVRIVSGYKAVDNLPYELTQLGVSRPLLITDTGIIQAGLLKIVQAAFDDASVQLAAVFDQTPPDSSMEIVKRVAAIYRNHNCDAFIALGGGSCIDTAKGVNIVITEQTEELAPLAGAEILSKPMQPCIVIPTTAGTGSEVTAVAVIADPDHHRKLPFTSRHLLPDVAVLDPRMTLSLPPRLTAATGMDALVHAMESYLSLQKNPLSDAYATSAIQLIRDHLLAVVRDGSNPQARLALAEAATMAGIAFSNAMVGVVHALGHAAGAVARVPHGEAMAILLPHGLTYNLKKVANQVGELLLPLAGAEVYANTPSKARAERTIDQVNELLRELNAACGLSMTLKSAGVDRATLPQMAQTALNDGALTYNPREVDYDDALRLLEGAYD
ncbi:MAG: iron-containing alcohol dehydrogenase [Desulfobacteraceae bacterium]|jgi:alcohol dehydrogenase